MADSDRPLTRPVAWGRNDFQCLGRCRAGPVPPLRGGNPLAHLSGQRALPDADLHSGRKDILIRVTKVSP